MNIPNKIIIEGKEYTSENIGELLSVYKNEEDRDWINQIYLFLKNWFDPSLAMDIKTSGSTGEPKVISKEKEVFVQSALATLRFFNLTEPDTFLLCLPATYIAGKMMLVRAMVSGSNILIRKPSANPFESVTCKINFTAVTPYQLIHSLKTLATGNIDKIIVGGSPVSLRLTQDIQFLSSEIYETYGMTETVSHIALKKLNGADKSDYFKLLPGISVQLDTRECLIIDAPLLNKDKLITNDIVSLKNENCFKWLGRADNVINSGGIKLYPEQIEKLLEGIIPSKYFIGSLPDNQLGEKLVLIIEGAQPAEEDTVTLKQHILKKLKPYQIPKDVIYIREFCTTSSDKIRRQEILRSLKLS